MRFVYLLLIAALVLILSGVSGCDSRLKFGLYRFELTGCPSEHFSLPTQVRYGEWEIKTNEPRFACLGFNYYLMTDEKFRSGGFGTPKVSGVYARVLSEKACSLLLAFSFDQTDPAPEERFRIYAETAAVAFLKETSVKARLPAKSFEVLGKKDDFEKWCTTK